MLHEGRHGRPKGDGRALTRAQGRKLLSIIVDKAPTQYKFPFALWNAKAIRELIRAEFGVEVSRRTVCRYMQRKGFTPQRPEKRAREQRAAQVRRRMERTYLSIRKAAKSVGAEIYWCDETGVSCRVSTISAESGRGALSFRACTGPMRMRNFLHFAKAVAHDSAAGKVVLIVDIMIFFLPAYLPELNPAELVNSDRKIGIGQ